MLQADIIEIRASDCESCPRGNGEKWCKGDCYWSGSEDGTCLQGIVPKVSSGPPPEVLDAPPIRVFQVPTPVLAKPKIFDPNAPISAKELRELVALAQGRNITSVIKTIPQSDEDEDEDYKWK